MKYLVNRETKEHVAYAGTPFYDDNEWRVVEADSEGWILWDESEESPLPMHCMCEIKAADGADYEPRSAHQNGWFATVAYRPILTEQSEFKPSNEWKPVPHDDDLPKRITCYGAGGGLSVFDRLRTATEHAASIPSIIAEIDAMLKPTGFCVARIPQEEPAPEQHAEDMSDWRNWKPGDEIRHVGHSIRGCCLTGRIYTITSLNGECAWFIGDDGNSYWTDAPTKHFKFHSRPTGASK